MRNNSPGTNIPRILSVWRENDSLEASSDGKALAEIEKNLVENNTDRIGQYLDKDNNRIRIYPLPPNQEALWFLHQMDPQNISYNVALAARLNSDIDTEILRRALAELTGRHAQLRSLFAGLNSKEHSAYIIELEKTVPYLEEIEAGDIESGSLYESIHEKYSMPFSLEEGPLLKTFLFRTEDHSYLLFNIHHIICDLWSLKIMFKELFDIYGSLLKDEDHGLPDNDFDYADYVIDQYKLLASSDLKDKRDKWTEKLHAYENPLILPYDYERPELQTFKGSTHTFSLDGELFDAVNRLSLERSITPNIFLYTAWELLMASLSGQDKFLIGTTVSARTKEEYKNLFGYLINILPLRCDIKADKSYLHYLEENRKNFSEIRDIQDIPLPLVVESVSPRRDPSRPVLFQVLYNFINRRTAGKLLHVLNSDNDKPGRYGEFSVSPYHINDQEGQFDMTLDILHDSNMFKFIFKYNTALFSKDTISEYEKLFLEIINDMVKDLEAVPSLAGKSKNAVNNEKVLITGTFTAEPLAPYLEFWKEKAGMALDFEFAGYNQVFQQLLNPSGDFNTNRNGYNIVLLRFEDLADRNSPDSLKVILDKKLNEFIAGVDTAARINRKGRYIISITAPSTEMASDPEIYGYLSEWENRIISRYSDSSNVFIIPSKESIEKYSVYDYYEPLGEEHGHIPYKEDYFVSLASLLVRRIHSFASSPPKAIAVDCDNTLWKGVVGEDGWDGIQIGKAEMAIQEFLIGQHSKGVLICLCSKNNEDDVFEVFEKNESMKLKKEHISFYRINWLPKSQNILSMSKEISIGEDSFVFVDDNPVECDEVRQNLPAVNVIHKPENISDAAFLINSWTFDRARITGEDLKRAKMYRDEADRSKHKSTFGNYTEFIASLDIEADINTFRKEDIPRISQLSFRTNQFNFTTIRRDELQMQELAADDGYDCFQVRVSDRFGEYGLTGVIIASKGKEYTIDSFLLSCRVLGKGLEHELVRFLGSKAKESGAETIVFRFRTTAKNIPAKMFLDQNFTDFAVEAEGGFDYRVPVSYAEELVFKYVPEEDSDDDGAEKKSIPKSPHQAIRERNELFRMISENLSTVDRIRQAGKNSGKPEKNQAVRAKKESVGSKAELTDIVTATWKEVLDMDELAPDDNFFDLGGHSVLIPRIVIDLANNHNIKINIVDIFQYPTINEQVAFISDTGKDSEPVKEEKREDRKAESEDIAVIGVAGRFPGSENIDGFWQTIINGKEQVVRHTREELEEKNVPKDLLDNPRYVYSSPRLDIADRFDSSFFGFTPREADFMDPQHRMFLEVCYEAMETSGYRKESLDFPVGVFGGCGMNDYLVKNILPNTLKGKGVGHLQTIINNNSDYLTTRASYKMNLRGPSIDLQTACSTSLVAVHMACRSIIDGDSKVALAGGSFIAFPRDEGYMYEPGEIMSPDGHCRPFDKNAEGTLFGEGAGVVVLKRLGDAVEDNDNILAVIKSTAINNDGSQKVGYMAPSVKGQSEVIQSAIRKSGIDPDTISYVETHGTGTKMGDPIEISALSQAYSRYTSRKGYCALGSVKANIGHLDAAAGISGLIKTVLLLNNKKLPPMVNFTEPNPELNIDQTPFYVNRELKDWETNGYPRRAAISSFGIGGTNAHCILEEAPLRQAEESARRIHFIPLSAKNKTAMQRQVENYGSFISESGHNIADIAFTLQQGREHLPARTVSWFDSEEGDRDIFAAAKDRKVTGMSSMSDPRVVFMFTGQGSQYIGMAKGLYDNFSLFKDQVDRAAEILKPYGIDVLKYLMEPDTDELRKELNQTAITQPMLYVIQYAIARLLQDFGVRADALIGHSIGELTAAALAGVFTFDEGLKLVYERGRLMQEQVAGAMLSVQLPAEKLASHLIEKTEISVVNAPSSTVVSGSFDAIDGLEGKLKNEFPDVHITRLKTSHAFHSYLIEPAAKEFAKIVSKIKLNKPQIPLISNITGQWADQNLITDPSYWGSHIRSKVDFAGGMLELLKDNNSFYFEVGPGSSLSTLLSLYNGNRIPVTGTTRHPRDKADDLAVFLKSISSAWVQGVNIDWSWYYQDEKRARIAMPTYPFERKKHWLNHVPVNMESPDRYNLPDGSADTDPQEAGQETKTEYFHERPEMENDYVGAETDEEKHLVDIWQELLGMGGIGVSDDFFALGGHSLLAASIINRINDDYESDINIDKFFQYPTIRGLLENSSLSLSNREQTENIPEIDYSSALPLSPSQERMWIINQIENNNPAYNISFTYNFGGQLDTDVFRNSIDILSGRHKILKSRIVPEDGKPVAYINDDQPAEIMEIDLSDVPVAERESRVQEIITEKSRETFDMGNGPLYRTYFLRLSERETIFHFVIHHIIFDGWSWGILTRELPEIYNSLLSGREPELDPVSLDYFEYSEKAVSEDTGSKYKESKRYWKEKLEGISGNINLPLDFKRKDIPSGEGGRVAFDIEKEKVDRIREYLKKGNSTLYMYFLSVFGLLMSRYSGDKDICIGSATANRTGSKLEKIIGLFINTVVLRLQPDEELTFSDFLKEVRQTGIEAISHQDLPFEELVEVLQPERQVNVNPVFQVLFAWQNAPRPPIEMEGIKSERISQQESVSPLDISFYAWEENGAVQCEIEYSSDIFRRESINAMKDNFIALLDRVAENRDLPMKELSVLSEYDKELLEQYNNSYFEYKNVPVIKMFEGAAAGYPDKVAVEDVTGENLTYAELNARADMFAAYLLDKGLKKGDVAGISLERNIDMLTALLGIMKTGAAYLPLDPAFPDDRLAYMIADSGASLLVLEKKFAERFAGQDVSTVLFDEEKDNILKYKNSKPGLEINKDDLAYIIYTSGSTGKPKGVKVHNEAVTNFITSMAVTPGLKPEDRLLAVTTLSFDISVLEIFLPLTVGAFILIADNEHGSNADLLISLMDKNDISVLQATPVTWSLLTGSGWEGSSSLKALCGGEALQPNLAKNLIPLVGSLWNMYGPTETTVWSTCQQITDHNEIYVGKPVNNTTIHILNGQQEQPPGVVGEVCIGGLGVSRGYHNRDDLNREKFIRLDGDLIYRTGDQGRITKDGVLEIFGRNDNQIKFHGFRIEPGEIEFHLSRLKDVKEAVVKLHRFSEADERLIAFLNVNESFVFNRDEIAGELEKEIPSYMIPSLYMLMSEFPRTLNGKIDKRALVYDPELAGYGQDTDTDERELTGDEEKLLSLWRDVLRINSIKANENFFDAGGNSLLVLSLLNRIEETFGVRLTFVDLVSNPTVTSLAKRLSNRTETAEAAIKLKHTEAEIDLPLTINQKRIWTICRINPSAVSYNIPISYSIEGELDRETFEKAVESVFNKNYTIFSVVNEVDGNPFIDILRHKPGIVFEDYSSLSEDDASKKTDELIIKDSRTPFDLREEPLYRAYLLKIAPDIHVFHMNIHHIIFDGWSWHVLVRDLQDSYNALREGREWTYQKPEFQEYDLAVWQEENPKRINTDALKEYWAEKLEGTGTILDLPVDKKRPEIMRGTGGKQTVRFTPELSGRFREIAKGRKASLHSVLMSVFGVMLQKLSGMSDYCIGTPLSDRPHSSLESVFGMFVDTLAVRMKTEAGMSLNLLIDLTNSNILEAIRHKELPFEEIVNTIKPERVSNVNPIFQVSFAWQNNINTPLRLKDARVERIVKEEGVSPFDITLYMWDNGEIIEGELEYSDEIFSHATGGLMKNALLTLAETLAGNPDKDIESAGIISEEDKEMVMEFNETSVDYPKDKTVALLFEEQVRLYPDKTALVYADEQYTFKELNSRANKLAHQLRQTGVGANTPVALYADRSAEAIIGILAILKAGAAYVPVDPEYPGSRVNYILEDCQAEMALVQEKYRDYDLNGIQKIIIGRDDETDSDISNPEVINSASDLAYIMYTSGTTGKPKGSLIRQYSISRLVINPDWIDLESDVRILLTGALVFDATTFEIWAALLNGGTLHVVDKDIILDPKLLGEELKANEISILWLTSGLFTQIAEQGTEIFSGLRYLLVGGDVLSAPHINRVRNNNPGLKVLNGYGPTENTTFSTIYHIERDYTSNIPIGKPISNSTAYIFDKNMNLLPVGVRGELYVGGDGVSKGYLNREDLDKEKFIENPVKKGEILYRTGDYARWMPDGNIEFFGRVDNQLKIRGFRVEPEEIEAVISDVAGVVETVIKPVKVNNDTRLVAFLNVSESFNLEKQGLVSYLRDKLPPYMNPYDFVIMSGFPKTINGKTDRSALIYEPGAAKSTHDGEKEVEMNDTEKVIYDIWTEVLKTKDISPEDNFFDIGGNSLVAISLFAKIESAFNKELRLREFFDSPRIKDLAELIDFKETVASGPEENDKGEETQIIEGEI
ncbi:MAG: amino acid adenylation domain-containing protein [Bacteroidales bacterium]|nr:amino acid adenylation domain-containing protein [Bacteroidales bacterium]